MCMNVDLPEPDGPVTARNSPRSHVEVDAAQRLHLDLADDVGLDEVLDRDDRGHGMRRLPAPAAARPPARAPRHQRIAARPRPGGARVVPQRR